MKHAPDGEKSVTIFSMCEYRVAAIEYAYKNVVNNHRIKNL